jgi:hypothetical protein
MVFGFEYIPGGVAIERYHGTPWILMLQTPTGTLRLDQFISTPLGPWRLC